jgi:Flp pilus assembly protein TadB
MHHYTAAILAAFAVFAAFGIANAYNEHRQRKAAQRKAEQREAMLTRAIERAFINASQKRQQERVEQLQGLEAIEAHHYRSK